MANETYTRYSPTSPSQATLPSQSDSCAADTPTCPACGGLACLCRPRFFPGQLLSDGELNRTVHYVVEKNKLRNRYLHGWGVASGLEVVCDPCDAQAVVVRSGYALSPCGEDIIVCQDQKVPVCSLIDACRESTDPCNPYASTTPQGCADEEQEWVLAVCYDEQPARGVSPLVGASKVASQTGCGCNGSAKSAGTSSAQSTTARKTYQPSCEPTQICEGFRFVAYRRPAATPGSPLDTFQKPAAESLGQSIPFELLLSWLYANRASLGSLVERVACCAGQAFDLRARSREGRERSEQTYKDYARALWELASRFPRHTCSFVYKVQQEYEAATIAENLNELELNQRIQTLDQVWAEILTECFCSALLPPGPAPVTSNCVPLAVVTIQRGNCRVVQICNWQERKLLITWPTVSYWLSWVPWQSVRNEIANLCCCNENSYTIWIVLLLIAVVQNRISTKEGCAPSPASTPSRSVPPRSVERSVGAPAPATAVGTAAETPAAPGGEAAIDFFKRAMAAERLLPQLLSDLARLRTAPEAGMPAWATVAARLADGSILDLLASGAGATGATDAKVKVDVEDLRSQVSNLSKTVEAQNKVIEKLRKQK